MMFLREGVCLGCWVYTGKTTHPLTHTTSFRNFRRATEKISGIPKLRAPTKPDLPNVRGLPTNVAESSSRDIRWEVGDWLDG